MAIAASTRVLENGARDLIIQCLAFDSAQAANTVAENGVTKITGSTYGLGAHAKVRRIIYTLQNYIVRVQWDGSGVTDLAMLGGYGDYNLDFHRSGVQGFWNDATAPNGNILFTTTSGGAAAAVGPAIYNITFFIVKGT